MREGDIVLVAGTGWFSNLIRRFTREPGEAPTEITHCALAVSSTRVVEAIGRGVVLSVRTHGEVWRPRNIDADALGRIVMNGLGFLHSPYGYGKIALHALDGLLGGAYLFRRMAFVKQWPICSYVVAAAYASEGYTFGVSARGATPDDIHDFVKANPDKYERVQ